jgi:hypothetical protein
VDILAQPNTGLVGGDDGEVRKAEQKQQQSFAKGFILFKITNDTFNRLKEHFKIEAGKLESQREISNYSRGKAIQTVKEYTEGYLGDNDKIKVIFQDMEKAVADSGVSTCQLLQDLTQRVKNNFSKYPSVNAQSNR